MDVAALGLKVQNQDVDRATESLGRLVGAADRAERSATGMGRGADRAGKQAARANEQAARSTDKLSKSFGGLNTSALAAARSMLGVVGAAVGIGAAVRTLSSFEQSMASVAAITRASTEDLAKLRDVAKEIGASTEFTASQAADGIKFLGMAGFNAQQTIAAFSDVVDLATAAQMDLSRAADIASNMMSAFGIAAENAADVSDVIAAATARANTDVEQLGEAMKMVGPVASAMGVSINDTAAAIGALSDAGIQGSMAGTGLRRILSTLANPTKKAADAIKGLGLSVKDLDPITTPIVDIVQKLRDAGLSASEAFTIFGDRGAPAILALVENNAKLNELTKGLSDVGGEAKRMADTMRDNLEGDLKGVQSAIEGVIIALGEAGLIRIFRAVIQWVTSFIRSVTSAINTIGQLTGAIADKLQPAFDVLGPVLSTVAEHANVAVLALAGFYSGKLIGGVLLLTRSIGVGLVGAFRALGVAIRANPIGFIITAIVTAGYAIYKFRDDIAQVLGFDIVKVAKDAANFLIGSFVAAYEDIKFVWNNFGDIIGGAAIGGVNVAIRAINGLIQGALSGINSLAQAIAKVIPGFEPGQIGQSIGIREILNPYADRLTKSVEERNKAIAKALSRDYIGATKDVVVSMGGTPAVADIREPSLRGAGGGGSGANSKEINKNAQAIRDLQQALHLAALSGKELAVEQARLTLNKYATAEQIKQVEDLGAAIFDVQEKMRRRQEFGIGKDADKFILGNTTPLSGGLFDNQFARYEAEAQQEQERYEKQLERLTEARELQIETNRTYNDLEAEAAQMHADRMMQIERAKQSLILTSTSDLLSGVADVLRQSHGEQSGIYRAMFAASKAFAIANATVNAYDAISKAWASAPYPANLSAVAATAPQVFAVVSAITGTGLTGMAHDGINSVPQTGTWLLEKGERVTTAETSARMDSVLERIDAGLRQGRGGPSGKGAVNVTVNVSRDGGTQTSAPSGMEGMAREIGEFVENKIREYDSRSYRQGGTAWRASQGAF